MGQSRRHGSLLSGFLGPPPPSPRKASATTALCSFADAGARWQRWMAHEGRIGRRQEAARPDCRLLSADWSIRLLRARMLMVMMLTTLAESTCAPLSSRACAMSRKPPWAAKKRGVVPVCNGDRASVSPGWSCLGLGCIRLVQSRLHATHRPPGAGVGALLQQLLHAVKVAVRRRQDQRRGAVLEEKDEKQSVSRWRLSSAPRCTAHTESA